jgi:D-serine deaminase-like pyridoxal phosphate-dependent protein
MRLADLPTPSALVDLDRLERNTRRMADRALHAGVRLRPHVKTHACVELAPLQVREHFGGLTVSTLTEARAFAAAGYRDLTWAVPFAPASLREALELGRSIDRLALLLDGEEALAELERAVGEGDPAPVWLKVDCGYHRAGVDPAASESERLAWALAQSASVDFRGLLTHAGQSYACTNREELRAVAEIEREAVVGLAGRLRESGVAVPEVSVGSTPTMAVAECFDGITEIRPGNYVFFDAFQAGLGSCSADDIAFSVLTSVIGCAPERGEALVDAGALALSKDRGAEQVDELAGHGWVAGEDGRLREGWRVRRLSQEHGQLSLPAGAPLRWGDRLRVLPAHSCLAAACFDRLHVHRGDQVVEQWRPIRRR